MNVLTAALLVPGQLNLLLGISTPVNRLAWDAVWTSSVHATSGAFFPNVTVVYALDAYNNTVATAEGVITAVTSSVDVAICDSCAATAPMLNGHATFTQLGLLVGVAGLEFAQPSGSR